MQDLVKKYPNLYAQGMYFECKSGWRKIIEDLSEKLEELIIEMKADPDCDYAIYAAQVKQKHGMLRFYLNQATDEMLELIDIAETASGTTCEACGEDGKARHEQRIVTECDQCFAEKS